MSKQANARRRYEVTSHDLPVSCPMPDMPLWSSHPKVYMQLMETGTAVCSYCDAKFVLTDYDANKATTVECDGDH
tara:strand:+ start:11696 stop:11920 length:225 start_codon:yes stop_codon:yes gene_type:complete